MPKNPTKARNPTAWPCPKKGKARALRKPAAVMNEFRTVPYVRHGQSLPKNRRERWGRSIQEFLNMGTRSLIRTLQKDKILPKHKFCPHCGASGLKPWTYCSVKKIFAYRCTRKFCMKRTQPRDFHPIFLQGRGNSKTSLQLQTAILYCAVIGLSAVQTHFLLDVDHKPVERIFTNLDIAKARYVVHKEKSIQYGGWKDVEADEVDLGKGIFPNPEKPTHNTRSEQWGGMIERGNPKSLRLFRLQPKMTTQPAPGPGPIRKREWTSIAAKYLAGRGVILHTDGARAYKLKVDQVVHCNVVHKKNKGQKKWQGLVSVCLYLK